MWQVAHGTNTFREAKTRSASYLDANSSHKNTFTLRQTASLAETHTNKEVKRRKGFQNEVNGNSYTATQSRKAGTGRSQRQRIPFSSALSGNLKQSELEMTGRIIIMKSLMVQFSFRFLYPLFSNVTEWNSRNLRRKLYEIERDKARNRALTLTNEQRKTIVGVGDLPIPTHKVTKT